MSKKQRREKVIQLFKPDEKMVSRWVTVDEIKESGLKWTSNGNTRRGKAFGMSDIIWEFEREKGKTSKIKKVKMNGKDFTLKYKDSIKQKIKDEIYSKTYCNISLLPLSKDDKEVDHRFGFKNCSKYAEIYKIKNQKAGDFQLLHRSVNQKKRQICKTCITNKKRPKHPILNSYVEGNNSLEAPHYCSGCYLAEPERYR